MKKYEAPNKAKPERERERKGKRMKKNQQIGKIRPHNPDSKEKELGRGERKE